LNRWKRSCSKKAGLTTSGGLSDLREKAVSCHSADYFANSCKRKNLTNEDTTHLIQNSGFKGRQKTRSKIALHDIYLEKPIWTSPTVV
jgi:hypothetical protein